MGSDNLSNEIHWPLKISLTTLILSLALSIFKFYVVGHKTNYCYRPINYYRQLFCTLSAESFLCLLDFGILSGGGQGGGVGDCDPPVSPPLLNKDSEWIEKDLCLACTARCWGIVANKGLIACYSRLCYEYWFNINKQMLPTEKKKFDKRPVFSLNFSSAGKGPFIPVDLHHSKPLISLHGPL